jgi:autotransporter-associated beta strand protein
MNRPSTFRLALAFWIVALSTAQAQFTWSPTPADSTFENGLNWGGSPPSANSNLTFAASTQSSLVFGNNFSASSLTFSGTYPAYTFSTGSSKTLSIGSGGISLGGSGAGVTFDPSLALALTAGQTWDILGNLTVAGTISSSPPTFPTPLTKTGAGTLTLTGSNTFIGTTTISAGTLQIGAGGTSGALPAGNVINNATLNYNRSDAVTVANVIDGTGSLVQSGTGTLTLTGSNTFTGTTVVSAGTLSIGAGGTSGSLVGNIANNSALRFNRSNAETYAGIISGSGTLTKLGAGTLTLTGANTYTGSTTLSAGTLALGAANRLADTTALSVNSGATFNLAGFSETVGSLAGAGNVTLGAGSLTAGGNNTSTTFSGVLSGTGGFTKAGTGTLTLAGENTYTGPTTISAGTLVAQAGANRLADTTALSVSFGATFDLDGAPEGVGSLAGAGNVTLGAGTLTAGGNNTSTTFSGVLSGTGGFTKSGTGTLTLTGANTYSGTTTISAGTLQIGAGGSLNGPVANAGTLSFTNPATQTLGGVLSGTGGLNVSAGSVTLGANNTFSGPATISGGKLLVTGSNTGGGSLTVGSGGTFGGTGSFSGPLVVNAGGAVAPGASPGILSVGATTFAGAGTFSFEINNSVGTAGSQWDLLSISGALNITATPANPFVVNLTSLTLSNTAGLLDGFNSANPYSWKFVQTTGGITGFSAGAFQYNAGSFENNLNGGSFFVSKISNDLFLNFTPVPEPSTYALMALGLGVIVLLARRRRS